jgi:hypothetical protein
MARARQLSGPQLFYCRGHSGGEDVRLAARVVSKSSILLSRGRDASARLCTKGAIWLRRCPITRNAANIL